MSDDFKREALLEKEVEAFQDKKLDLLRRVKDSKGLEKVKAMDEFLELDKKQAILESDLDNLRRKIYADEYEP